MGSQANAASDLERAEHQDGAKKVLVFGYDDATSSHVQLNVDSNGFLKTNDLTADYKITDIDDAGYFGFTKSDGGWYIMFENAGSWKYLKGDAGYTTAWTNRVGASYDYFYNIF